MPWPRGNRRYNPGTLRLRIGDLAVERGITNQFGTANMSAIHAGAEIPTKSLWNLIREPERRQGISLDMIARLCRFFNCQPGDLFEYTPPREEETPITAQNQRVPTADLRAAPLPDREW